jgi:hypothetical protein
MRYSSFQSQLNPQQTPQAALQRILHAICTPASRAQLPNLLRFPAHTHQIQGPLLIFLLQELDGERLGPILDHIAGVGDHIIERLEGDAKVGNALPLVVHVDVQL